MRKKVKVIEFLKFVDELQSVLDKNKICSEVHMIFENKNF